VLHQETENLVAEDLASALPVAVPEEDVAAPDASE
jgi:hypothetical protein